MFSANMNCQVELRSNYLLQFSHGLFKDEQKVSHREDPCQFECDIAIVSSFGELKKIVTASPVLERERRRERAAGRCRCETTAV